MTEIDIAALRWLIAFEQARLVNLAFDRHRGGWGDAVDKPALVVPADVLETVLDLLEAVERERDRALGDADAHWAGLRLAEARCDKAERERDSRRNIAADSNGNARADRRTAALREIETRADRDRGAAWCRDVGRAALADEREGGAG